MIKNYFGILAATALTTASFSASAVVVTDWGIESNSAWIDFTDEDELLGPSDPVTGSANNVLLGEPTVLSWGEPGPILGNGSQSALTIVGESASTECAATPCDPSEWDENQVSPGLNTGTLVTDGNPTPTTTIIHSNFVILEDTGELDTATLLTVATLDPLLPDPPFGPPGDAFPAPAFTFFINFEETRNDPGAGSCPATGTSEPCPDIFVVSLPPGFNPATGSVDFMFPFMGETYLAQLFVGGITALDAATCGATGGPAEPCFGFITSEGLENRAQVSFRISLVPEPGILSLLGLGLLGLFGVRRFSK